MGKFGYLKQKNEEGMNEWDLFNRNVLTYFKNCGILKDRTSVLRNTKTLYKEGFAVNVKRTLGQYSQVVKMELYERLTDKNTSVATIKLIDSEFEPLIEQLTKIIDDYDLRNTPIRERFYPTSYYLLIQPIFELKEWYDATKDSLRNPKGRITFDEVDYESHIFQDNNTYEMFLYLVDRFDNDKEKSKFSHLFHFIQENQDKQRLRNAEYINFVQEKYGVKLSKIQPKTLTYSDSIKGRLTLYVSNFRKQE